MFAYIFELRLMKQYIFLLITIFCFYTVGKSQSSTVLDNTGPKIKWFQVKTPHFKIIYPEGFSEQGQRMANTMEHIYKPGAASLGVEPKKNFPLILQNNSSASNGFVTMGPRRSEFYTMSPQRPSLLGNNDWLDMLALHEYRHVVQYDRSRTGLTGFLRTIFGEYTQAAIAGTTVPSWYWEGDAVGIETALSKSGRGRIPEFSAAFRANLLENGPYNYNKAYLRSYKHFIPNHYVLGYHYSTYLRQEFGAEALENMVNRTWAQPYIPFGFSFAQKKFGEKKIPGTYFDMMDYLKSKWEEQQALLDITTFEKINSKRKKVYTNYNYPQILDNGNLLVLKSGLADYAQFIELDTKTGEETVLFTPGVMNNAAMLSASAGQFVWNEYEYDARWRQQSYSVVKLYNIASKDLRVLSSKSRYSAATLSPDRTKVATIEQSMGYQNSIVTLDAYSGQLINSINWETGKTLTNPVWSDNENIIVAEVEAGKKRIIQVNLVTGKVTELLSPSFEHITYAFRNDDQLYYVSGLTGIDNIYVKDLSTGQKYQVTSSRFGAYSPELSNDGRILYYNELNSMGTDVVSIKIDPSKWLPLEQVPGSDVQFYDVLVEQEGNAEILSTVPENKFEESRYRKKLGKLHSWGPYLSGSAYDLEAGLYSTNIMSTTDIFLGFQVDTNLNFKWVGRASFQAWYPIIDIQVDHMKRTATVPFLAEVDSVTTVLNDVHSWDETGIKSGFRIPWLLTNSKFYTSLEVRNYVGFTLVRNFNSEVFGDSYYPYFIRFSTPRNNGNLISNEFRLQFISLHSRSQRDIRSKWGTVLTLETYGTPYGGDFNGGLTALKGQFYFPGLLKNHSLNFFTGYQHNKVTLDDNNYRFANRMPYPRGVAAESFENFYTIRTNYDLPLLYPDLSIGPWLYIQRIKAQVFYDFGKGFQNRINESNTGLSAPERSKIYYSTGAELSVDFNFMRALPMLELGVRYSYLPDLGTSNFEFLIGSFGF